MQHLWILLCLVPPPRFRWLTFVAVMAVLTGCGGGSSSAENPSAVQVGGSSLLPPHQVGGSVSGLNDGNSVTLLNNGGDALKLRADGSFSFATEVPGAYAVTIERQPLWQDCAVSNGAGTASADVTNVRIVCTDIPAQVSTVAGTGNPGHADGPAAVATFLDAYFVAADGSGNLYVSEYGISSPIRKIAPSGDVTTLTTLADALGVAVGPDGTLYVSSGLQIYKVTPTGVATPFAGDGSFASADGNGLAASFAVPVGLAFDRSGNLYVAEAFGNVRRISPSGDVTTVATSVVSLGWGIAVGADGNIYVSDFSGSVIRITQAGVVTLFAGGIARPASLAVAPDGALFVAETDAGTIRRISPAGVVTTLAAGFNGPTGLAFDADGNLYVTEVGGNKVRKIGRP